MVVVPKRKRPFDKGAYGPRAFSGWMEHRFGQTRRKVKMPLGFGEVRPVLDKSDRAEAVRRTAEILRLGTASKWEFEATCRHALRTGFILNGHPWPESDEEAKRIVSAALVKIGAKLRPDWKVGQPQITLIWENCQNCGGPIDIEDATAGHRFCSQHCWGYARRNHEEWERYIGKIAYARMAYWREKAEGVPRPCKACGEPFRTPVKDQEYCSHKCAASVRTNNFTHHTCENCQRPFINDSPKTRSGRFCSQACRTEFEHTKLPERECAERDCENIFKPNALIQVFCSARCRRRDSARKIAERKRQAA